ncbi:helix-turn-helix domain-containing protein [Aeromicrobium massiliense]|uniref:helix-turn-helix domain-containing protein n=1 Tax=Aeromicrobium massiliense TaxID=1464554 RepID=UPI0002DFB244|nr:LuxR C-terminal-related transcriptional regulator [Aeromicrobium massiliense]
MSTNPRATGAGPAERLATLDASDLHLLRLVADGHTAAGTATRLDVSERTVRRRLRDVCDRLEVQSPIEAVVLAVRHGRI